MRAIDLGTLATATAGTAKKTIPGEIVSVFVNSPDGAFAGTAVVQTSPDGATWTTAYTMPAGKADMGEFTTSAYARLNLTARTAGNVSAKVLQSPAA